MWPLLHPVSAPYNSRTAIIFIKSCGSCRSVTSFVLVLVRGGKYSPKTKGEFLYTTKTENEAVAGSTNSKAALDANGIVIKLVVGELNIFQSGWRSQRTFLSRTLALTHTHNALYGTHETYFDCKYYRTLFSANTQSLLLHLIFSWTGNCTMDNI